MSSMNATMIGTSRGACLSTELQNTRQSEVVGRPLRILIALVGFSFENKASSSTSKILSFMLCAASFVACSLDANVQIKSGLRWLTFVDADNGLGQFLHPEIIGNRTVPARWAEVSLPRTCPVRRGCPATFDDRNPSSWGSVRTWDQAS